MKGKDKCNYLKKLRNKAAKANGIDYHSEECKFKGECLGTCPKCEAELRELTKKINEKNRRKGLIGASIGVAALGLVGCTNTTDVSNGMGIVGPNIPSQVESDNATEGVPVPTQESNLKKGVEEGKDDIELSGNVVYVPPKDTDETEETCDDVLMGDVEVSIDKTTEQLELDEPLPGEYMPPEETESESSEDIPTNIPLEPLAGVAPYIPEDGE